MKNIPEKIYLQLGFEPDNTDDFLKLQEVTWAGNRINDTDLEFNYIPKADRIDRIAPWIGVFIIVAFSSFMIWLVWSKSKPHVEQELFIDTSGHSSFLTILWSDHNIVKAWWDPIEISDSLKKARLVEANRILETIK